MIAVQRISHATYETPDLARQIDYYTRVVGLRLAERGKARGKDRAILTTRLGALQRARVPARSARRSQAGCGRAYAQRNRVRIAQRHHAGNRRGRPGH
jgi:catechol 2,3-dioxygenase-like lactoylglutathione lyase family enzyme